MAHKTRDNVCACVFVCVCVVCVCVCVCVCVILYSVYNLPVLLFVETIKHVRPSVRKRGGWGEDTAPYRMARTGLAHTP